MALVELREMERIFGLFKFMILFTVLCASIMARKKAKLGCLTR